MCGLGQVAFGFPEGLLEPLLQILRCLLRHCSVSVQGILNYFILASVVVFISFDGSRSRGFGSFDLLGWQAC